jgi:hypothetical protein
MQLLRLELAGQEFAAERDSVEQKCRAGERESRTRAYRLRDLSEWDRGAR